MSCLPLIAYKCYKHGKTAGRKQSRHKRSQTKKRVAHALQDSVTFSGLSQVGLDLLEDPLRRRALYEVLLNTPRPGLFLLSPNMLLSVT
jgi:hypothetical protein